MFSSTISLVLLSLASSIFAKTDLAGCISSQTVVGGGASLLWYVPDSGEVCELLDCGGGRAPPKTDVPGCAAYVGSAAYTPRFLAGFGPPATLTSTGPVPTTGILTDTSIPSPASTLIPIASTTTTSTSDSAALAETTSTLDVSSTESLVTSSLLFDTNAVSTPVNTIITVTSSRLPASVTANAASGARGGNEFLAAAVGAVAGLAML